MEKMDKVQTEARDEVAMKMASREYKMIPNPCVCGNTGGDIVEKIDRYNLPITTVLCDRCGLMRTDPYYDQSSLESFYLKEYRPLYLGKESPTENFFERQRYDGKVMSAKISEHMGGIDFKGKKVFDVGCGAGGATSYFKDLGAIAYGCDFGEKYVTFGKSRGLDLLVGDSSVLAPYAPADVIVLRHVLEHMADPVKSLADLRKLLAPNGILYVEVPGTLAIKHSYSGNILKFIQNAHVWHFTKETLKYVAGLAGYRMQYGDESISAILCKDERVSDKNSYSKEEYAKVKKYIESTRRTKYIFMATAALRKRAAIIKSAILGK